MRKLIGQQLHEKKIMSKKSYNYKYKILFFKI
jgi:hypothetical protein